MGIENFGTAIDNTNAQQGKPGDGAAAAAARDAWSETDGKPNDAARVQLNNQLQQSGLIPSLEITGINNENQMTVHDATMAGQPDSIATINGNTLEYTRNNTGDTNGLSENVNIDLATGREVITEADGSETIRGQAGAAETIAVSAINPETGQRTVTMPSNADGTPGRNYQVDQNGQISYDVQEGDNLWSIATDVAKIQGNESPTDQQIFDVVNQISHVGANGDGDDLSANETIKFGKGSDSSDQVDLALPSDNAATLPEGVTMEAGKLNYHGQELPNVPDNPQFTSNQETNSFSYQDSNGNEVTVWKPAEGQSDPVVMTKYDDQHVEYRQGENSIWTDGSNGDNNWYARRDDGATVQVTAPYDDERGLMSHGEIRTTNADPGSDEEFILGGSPTGSNNGWN